MNRLRTHRRLIRAAGILALGLTFLALPSRPARAQMWGYGAYGSGYGFPGAAYANPAGYGYAYAGPGVGYYYGYPAPGYGGPAGFGLGYGYGYPAYNYGFYGNGYPGPSVPLGAPAVYANPLFGVGLSPLGVQSGLSEAALLGATRRYSPSLKNPNLMNSSVTNPATQYYGTGSARPR